MEKFMYMKFEKVYLFVGDSFNFADVKILLQKVRVFLANIIPLLKVIYESCDWGFYFWFQFWLDRKLLFMEILVLQIMDPDSDFRISLNLN